MKKENQSNSLSTYVRNRYDNVKLATFTRSKIINGRVMRGRAIFNESNRFFRFFERPKDTSSLHSIYRTQHLILTPRVDGTFYTSIRFSPDEKNIRRQLQKELNNVCAVAELYHQGHRFGCMYYNRPNTKALAEIERLLKGGKA